MVASISGRKEGGDDHDTILMHKSVTKSLEEETQIEDLSPEIINKAVRDKAPSKFETSRVSPIKARAPRINFNTPNPDQ